MGPGPGARIASGAVCGGAEDGELAAVHSQPKDYAARRTAEGKAKTAIMRCLKRHIAREVFPYLLAARGRAPLDVQHRGLRSSSVDQ
jgi:hypothetical protein